MKTEKSSRCREMKQEKENRMQSNSDDLELNKNYKTIKNKIRRSIGDSKKRYTNGLIENSSNSNVS